MTTKAKHFAFAVAADGTKIPIDAQMIVVQFDEDKEVEIDLQPHDAFQNKLVLHASIADPEENERKYCVFSVEPGACNVIHLSVNTFEKKL